MKENLLQPFHAAYMKRKLRPIHDWLYGPAYESLPHPIKDLCLWTEDPVKREQALDANIALAAQFGFGIGGFAYHSRHNTIWDVDRLTLQIWSPRHEGACERALQLIPGVGPQRAFLYSFMLETSAYELKTSPGYILVERPDLIDSYLQKCIEICITCNASRKNLQYSLFRWDDFPPGPVQKPSAKELRLLREWWIDNGGSA